MEDNTTIPDNWLFVHIEDLNSNGVFIFYNYQFLSMYSCEVSSKVIDQKEFEDYYIVETENGETFRLDKDSNFSCYSLKFFILNYVIDRKKSNPHFRYFLM